MDDERWFLKIGGPLAITRFDYLKQTMTGDGLGVPPILTLVVKHQIGKKKIMMVPPD